MYKTLFSILFCCSALSMLSLVASASTSIRVATFNVSMEARNYTEEGENHSSSNQASVPLSAQLLKNALMSGKHMQIKNVAEILQRVRPNIVLLNEFDFIENPKQGILAFQNKYLAMSQKGAKPIRYPYFYIAPVNTGVLAPVDLNNDGNVSLPGDGFGFGFYPGHYGMAVLSQFPINRAEVRTFQKFLWRDMPGAKKPQHEDGKPYYSDAAWDVFRLSSKSHWDIPINVNGEIIHILASHPTPPVFDGPENRNGKRNHDEIRFWTDYISEEEKDSAYIYDDKKKYGGLGKGKRFVVMGDLNASMFEGDGIHEGIRSLIKHEKIMASVLPKSVAGKENKPDSLHSESHTAQWGMLADYVLPSIFGFEFEKSGIFWPRKNSEYYRLVDSRKSSSDHRLVWLQLKIKK